MSRTGASLLGLLIALIIAVLVSGCASVRPDYLTAGFVHQSQPFIGPGPPPIGDYGDTPQSNFDGVEGGLRWERGKMFAEASAVYMLHNTNVAGGDWMCSFRAGARLKLGD